MWSPKYWNGVLITVYSIAIGAWAWWSVGHATWFCVIGVLHVTNWSFHSSVPPVWNVLRWHTGKFAMVAEHAVAMDLACSPVIMVSCWHVVMGQLDVSDMVIGWASVDLGLLKPYWGFITLCPHCQDNLYLLQNKGCFPKCVFLMLF